MEKLIMKPYDKEFMKMAILKHEETFKQQVYELHRLYQIQKSLMRSLRTKPSTLDQININNSLQGFLDLEKPAIEDGLDLEMEEECEIELTLGPSNFYKSTKKAETRSRTSSFSSSTSTTGSSHIMKRKTIISARINERNRDELSFDHVQKEDKMIKHHPHWLYQTLSLNMT